MHYYRWYAVYTHANSESMLFEHLLAKGYDVYLPRRAIRQMIGFKTKTTYEPLFKSHVFVRTLPEGLAQVKEAPGFSHMIRNGHYLAAIPETHIVKIKTILHHYDESTSIANNLVEGVTVAVINGPLKGLTGLLVDGEGERPVAMEVGQLDRSIMVNVPMATVFRTEMPTPA
ncbi:MULTISPECIES: transcription termination/antitermination NusG family protein [Enterovibrio]|uniref:transcription termination/antitermination NusG family protein n=1 Tax=Enterovibrio TaxID=188143 RepID=UPI00031D83D1|nr:transcription termination/antitermination NusG family protein [Enterovibrio norvegicus]